MFPPLQVRYRREPLSARQCPYFPWVEDLMRDGSDGAALLAVIHYYCPEQMKLDGECSEARVRIPAAPVPLQLPVDVLSEAEAGEGPS